MANKKNTNTNKSDVKKDSLKNTSNTSNKSNSKGNTMKKVIKVKKVMSVDDKRTKLIEKREKNDVIMHRGKNNRTAIAKIFWDNYTASNGKTYYYIIDTDMTFDAIVIDIGNTGLSGQGKETCFEISKAENDASIIRLENVSHSTVKKNIDKMRNGLNDDDYFAKIFGSTKVSTDKETKEKVYSARYPKADLSKKSFARIHDLMSKKYEQWIKTTARNIAIAMANKEKKTA